MLKRAIARCKGVPPNEKDPITIAMLTRIRKQLDLRSSKDLCFWAACLVAFFPFIRKSTLLPKSANVAAKSNLSLNQDLAQQLLTHANWINEKTLNSKINPVDIMRWPGVMEAEEGDITAIQVEILAGFDQALTDFIAARASEGSNLKGLIEQRLDGIVSEAEKVKSHMPAVIQWQRNRITDKFADANIDLDSGRVEQELVLLAQKMDVDEELDRLYSHVKETRNILKKGGAQGRRLDFMMQEFNREANTLGSKSINAEITTSAVELKVLIEQMREQIKILNSVSVCFVKYINPRL